MSKRSNRYQKERRKAMRSQELLETLPRHKCSTFTKVDSHLLIPTQGVCIHKRSLWIDGKYVGIVERLIMDEDLVDQIDLQPGQAKKEMPPSEYEFVYHPRSG